MHYTLNLNTTDRIAIIEEHMVVNTGVVLPLTLYGPHILFDYGEQFQNNFYYLIENYASATSINSPTPGMLWLDCNGNSPALKIYTDDYAWKRVLFDYENKLDIIIQNGTDGFNSLVVGQELSVIITNDSTAILNPIRVKWYYNGVLTTVGSLSISPVNLGYYFATYAYINSENKSITVQSPTYRLIEYNTPSITGIANVEISRDFILNTITATLVYSDITSFSIEWEWEVDDEVIGRGNAIGASSTITIQQPGAYRITAKYNDTYHTGADKVTVGGFMRIY